MANEAAAAAASAGSPATITTTATATTSTALVHHARPHHGPLHQPHVHLHARRRHATLSGVESGAHEHHLRRARALVEEMAGRGHRHRMQSSPALLSFPSPRKPVLPTSSSSSSLELRSAAIADVDSDAEYVDTGDEGDDEGSDPGLGSTDKDVSGRESPAQSTEAIVLALALLQQAQEASSVDGVVTLSKDALTQILSGFLTTLKMAVGAPAPATTAATREVRSSLSLSLCMRLSHSR
jgi:hypothetical protein